MVMDEGRAVLIKRANVRTCFIAPSIVSEVKNITVANEDKKKKRIKSGLIKNNKYLIINSDNCVVIWQ